MPREGNVASWNASSDKNSTIGGAQVDMGLASGCIPRYDAIQVKSCLTKCCHYFIAHLKTILADTGPHCGLDAVDTSPMATHLINHIR